MTQLGARKVEDAASSDGASAAAPASSRSAARWAPRDSASHGGLAGAGDAQPQRLAVGGGDHRAQVGLGPAGVVARRARRARRPGPSSRPRARRAAPARRVTAARCPGRRAPPAASRHRRRRRRGTRPRARPARARAASAAGRAISVIASARPSRASPARASTTASSSPSATKPQPGVDVAAHGDDLEAEAERAQLRGPARRAGADPRPGRQLAQRQPVAGDEHVAGVLARRHGGEHEPRRRRGRQVLERVHGQVDLAAQQRVAQRGRRTRRCRRSAPARRGSTSP